MDGIQSKECNMELSERQAEKAAEQYAFANSAMVSTETHSTAFVARHFLAWREKQKQTLPTRRVIKGAKAAMAKKKSNGGLRQAAFNMFAGGSTPKQVSVELGITYANAHYYKRAMAK